MGFRRYGGDLETKNLGGSGRFTWPAFIVAVLGTFISIAADSILIFLIFFVLALVILLLGTKFPRKIKNKFKHKRVQQHYENAKREFRQGLYMEALESIRRAKIYGNLPNDVQNIEALAKRRVKNA